MADNEAKRKDISLHSDTQTDRDTQNPWSKYIYLYFVIFLVHEKLYKEMNNEIIGKKRGNYSKMIKEQGPFRPALVKLSHRKNFKNGVWINQ